MTQTNFEKCCCEQEVVGNTGQGHIIDGIIREDWFSVQHTTRDEYPVKNGVYETFKKVNIPSNIVDKYDGDFTSVDFKCLDIAGRSIERISVKVHNNSSYTLWVSYFGRGKSVNFTMICKVRGKRKM